MKCETSDECFRHCVARRGVDSDGDPDLVGLFAYALIEADRLAWIDHRANEGMSEPTAEDVKDWFRNKPGSYFAEKEKQAVTRFDGYARGYLAEDIEHGKKEAVAVATERLRNELTASFDTLSATILRETTDGHWWRSAAQGWLGNFAFALTLVFLAVIASKDPSLVAWVREVFLTSTK